MRGSEGRFGNTAWDNCTEMMSHKGTHRQSSQCEGLEAGCARSVRCEDVVGNGGGSTTMSY